MSSHFVANKCQTCWLRLYDISLTQFIAKLSTQMCRLKPADDSLLRPVGKLHNPNRYALSRGIGRSTERKPLGNGFVQSGPTESLQWKQQLDRKAMRKSS